MNNDNNRSREIDLVDFSSSAEMSRIREQERLEREAREKQAYRLKRAELIRRKRMQQMKETVMAWSVVALVVLILVAVIAGIASSCSKDVAPEEPQQTGDKISSEQISLVKDFKKAEGVFYGKSNNSKDGLFTSVVSAAKSVSDTLPAVQENGVVHGSDLSLLVDAYLWNGSFSDRERIKQLVRDYPVYSNGYVWSSEKELSSPVTGSYLYDTNAAFISAVCGICKLEGNGNFLDIVDVTTEPRRDISGTNEAKTVGDKLEKATAHFFDTVDDGVRYNHEDGLVYVRTAQNNGTDTGVPSNLFMGYRFGYVDTYINLTFNKAMQDLEELYTLLGDKEKAQLYADYAEKNRTAINKKLYNAELGRYIACIDKTGKVHDNGFTSINLMAVAFGVADEAKSEKILSWIEGERNVKSDDVKGKDILENGLIPVFSTVAESGAWWQSKNQYPVLKKEDFGEHWLNGAPSAISADSYLLYKHGSDSKTALKYAKNILSSENSGKLEKLFKGNGEPELYYDLLLSNSLKTVLGVSADGKMLTVNCGFDEGKLFGVKDIAFCDNMYDFLFDGNSTYVFADKDKAVKLCIGGFSKSAKVTMTVVTDDEITLTKDLTANSDGMLEVSHKFGADTYLKFEQTKKE